MNEKQDLSNRARELLWKRYARERSGIDDFRFSGRLLGVIAVFFSLANIEQNTLLFATAATIASLSWVALEKRMSSKEKGVVTEYQDDVRTLYK